MSRSPRSEFRLFISYRRADTAKYASRLHASLEEHYSRDNVFLDIITIEPGSNFPEEVDQAITDCDVLLLVIGENFLRTVEPNQRELNFIHIELRAALDRGIRVVPVLMDGVEMPPSTEWPKDLTAVTARNAFPINNDDWEGDVGRLVEALKRKPVKHRSSYSIRAQHPDSIKGDTSVAWGFERNFDDPSMDVSETARVLAQWFRSKGYVAQVLHRTNDTVVQCCDPAGWRSAVGAPLVLSIGLSTRGRSLAANFQPGAWVDQSIPEGVATKGPFEIPDAAKKVAILTPMLFLPFSYPLLGASVFAAFQVGKKKKGLIKDTEDFLKSILDDAEIGGL